MWVPAAAAAAIALAAVPASGGPTASSAARAAPDLRLAAPGGRPLRGAWQQWARASLMPTVGRRVTLKLSGCPALPRAAGCVYRRRPRTIYLRPGLRHPRSVLLHELGHLFDLRVMNNSDRGGFRRVMRARRRAWWSGRIPLAEQFAEAYSFCARYRQIVSIARYSTYRYRPSRRQHAKVCALIIKAGTDRAPAVPPARAPAVTRPDPAPPAQPPPSTVPGSGGRPQPRPTPAPAPRPTARRRSRPRSRCPPFRRSCRSPADAQRSSLQTRSATSAVKAARRLNEPGQPARAVGERDRAVLEPDAVGEDRATGARQLETERGLRLEVARELARRQQPLGPERDRLAPVAAHGAVVGDQQPHVGVAVRAAADDLEEVGGRSATAAEHRRGGQAGERAPHTTTSWAPATSRRNRGVDMTPSSHASTSAALAPVSSTAAAHAHSRQSSSSRAVARSSTSERANVRGGLRARGDQLASSSGPSAPKDTSPRAGRPSAAAETSSERPV